LETELFHAIFSKYPFFELIIRFFSYSYVINKNKSMNSDISFFSYFFIVERINFIETIIKEVNHNQVGTKTFVI